MPLDKLEAFLASLGSEIFRVNDALRTTAVRVPHAHRRVRRPGVATAAHGCATMLKEPKGETFRADALRVDDPVFVRVTFLFDVGH
jgi:hypothetical protein